MKARKRMKIRVETHETTIIRFRRKRRRVFCRRCDEEVFHLRVAEAAAALSFSEKSVFRLAEADRLHATENADGQLLLCANSLAALARCQKSPGDPD